MHQQGAVFKKRVSFGLVSRVSEATVLLLSLVLLTAWLSQPPIANLQRSRGKGKKGKSEGKSSSHKGGKVPKPWYTWSLAKIIDLTFRVSSTDVQEASARSWHTSWWTI